MANTREILGDKATLDGLVAHTLENLEENGVVTLRNYALYKNTGLKSVNFPNVTSGGQYAFQDCTSLTNVQLAQITRISQSMFNGCTALTTLNIPNVTTIVSSAFQNCTSLNNINLSNITTLDSSLFNGCKKLSTIDLSNTTGATIPSYCFQNSGLVHLIIRANSVKSLQNINAFNNTPLKYGIGAIYVPSELVNSYKTATNWSTFADQIHPISEYPITDFGTITDSWAQIAAASSDGTYVNKYNVGDTKTVNLDGTYIMMRIVGINKDEDANGNIIPLSFISDSFYTRHKMNESNTSNGGYPNCLACDYLESTVLPLLEDAIGSSNLKMAKKTYINRIGNSLTTDSYNCKIWIPSLRELNYTGTFTKEDSGCVYDQYYTPGLTNNNQNKYIKYDNSSGYFWWLRSAGSAYSSFCCVSDGGNAVSLYASSISGLAFGFCI